MTEFLIGAGGWAYFHVPGEDQLEAYSRAFNFVEVNSTFYELPGTREVESWRRRVPEDFEFTVRCHRDLTHVLELAPTEGAFRVFEKMRSICRALGAGILHMQSPPRIDYTEPKIEAIRSFLSSIDLKDTRIAWEIRAEGQPSIPANMVRLMQDFNVIHSVDLSREEPAYESDTVYARLFGKGYHNIYQFTDEELREIDDKANRTETKAILSFHGLRMYKDAARFKTYKQTGTFPQATKSTGLESLREVLSEDAILPATKEELLMHQGWKIIDLTKTRRVHASELLSRLPEQTYMSIEQLIQVLGTNL